MLDNERVAIFNNLPEIEVSWRELFLDPNNPRLHSGTEPPYNTTGDEGVALVKRKDPDLRQQMGEFNIDDLMKPMGEKGFVYRGIPAMLVKKLSDDCYLVLEGNRRLTAIKKLMDDHHSGQEPLAARVLESFERMKVVDCSELNEAQIEEYLGMIHIGGTKPWDLLPRAKYLFSQFMRNLCAQHSLPTVEMFDDEFLSRTFDELYDKTGKAILKEIADLSSTKVTIVKKSVMLYRLYIQVNQRLLDIDAEAFDLKNTSTLEETMNKKYCREFFQISDKSFTFSEDGLDKWIDACCWTPENQEHEDETKRGPVIKQAAAGESNIRDFEWILKNDESEDKRYVKQVLHDRRSCEVVKSSLLNGLHENQLELTLEDIHKMLSKITLEQLTKQRDDNLGEWSQATEANLDKVKEKFDQIFRIVRGEG